MDTMEMVRGLVRAAEFKEQEDRGPVGASVSPLWDDECRRSLEHARSLGWGKSQTGTLCLVDGKAMTRDRATEIAVLAAKANRPSYYREPFEPHSWVIDAVVLTSKLESVPAAQATYELERTRAARDEAIEWRNRAEGEASVLREEIAQWKAVTEEIRGLPRPLGDIGALIDKLHTPNKPDATIVQQAIDTIENLRAYNIRDGRIAADAEARAKAHSADIAELSERLRRTERDLSEISTHRDAAFKELQAMREATGFKPEGDDWGTVTAVQVKAWFDKMRENADHSSKLVHDVDVSLHDTLRDLSRARRDLATATAELEEAHSALDGTDVPRRGPMPTSYNLTVTHRMQLATKDTADHIDGMKRDIDKLNREVVDLRVKLAEAGDELEAERRRCDELTQEMTKGADPTHIASVLEEAKRNAGKIPIAVPASWKILDEKAKVTDHGGGRYSMEVAADKLGHRSTWTPADPIDEVPVRNLSDGALLRVLGDDAGRWASAFMRIVVKPGVAIDEGLMIGWFANAIESRPRPSLERALEADNADTLRRRSAIVATAITWVRVWEFCGRGSPQGKAMKAAVDSYLGTGAANADIAAGLDRLQMSQLEQHDREVGPAKFVADIDRERKRVPAARAFETIGEALKRTQSIPIRSAPELGPDVAVRETFVDIVDSLKLEASCSHPQIIPLKHDPNTGVCTTCGDASFPLTDPDPQYGALPIAKPPTTSSTLLDVLASKVVAKLLGGA